MAGVLAARGPWNQLQLLDALQNIFAVRTCLQPDSAIFLFLIWKKHDLPYAQCDRNTCFACLFTVIQQACSVRTLHLFSLTGRYIYYTFCDMIYNFCKQPFLPN